MTTSVPAATAFEYAGDGATLEFSFPLRFIENDDLHVYVNGVLMVRGTHYSVDGAGELAGGAVTFEEEYVPASGSTVRLARATAAKQTVDLSNLTRTPGDTLELQLDRLAMVSQDHGERLDDIEEITDDLTGAVEAAQAAQAGAEQAQTGAETAEDNTEGFKDAAELARDEAVAAATSLNLPTIGAGDAGKTLVVTVAEDGYELIDPVAAAADVTFDPSGTGLSATDVQAALAELDASSVPSGGTTGQVLAKASATDHDTTWVDRIGGSTGSADNRLLRSDGTGGATLQASPVTVDDSGNMTGVGTLSTSAGITINSSQGMVVETTTPAALLVARKPDTPGSAGTIGYFDFEARDNAGTLLDYICRISARQDAIGAGSVSATLRIATINAGTAADRCFFGAGVYHPSATGGDKGNNTINFGAVYDDNSLLTCMAMAEEFIERGEINLDKWDAMVPDQIVPESREEVPLYYDVVVEQRRITTEADDSGRLVRRVETVAESIQVPAFIADPVYDEQGAIVDAVETPLTGEVVVPERVIVREHRTARVFKTLLDSGFDPRDPAQYFAKMRSDEALPGMPTQANWQHGGLSMGEMQSQQWLAMEMLAIVCNVMWGRLLDLEQRVAVIENG